MKKIMLVLSIFIYSNVFASDKHNKDLRELERAVLFLQEQENPLVKGQLARNLRWECKDDDCSKDIRVKEISTDALLEAKKFINNDIPDDEPIIKRNPDEQLVERWTCPWYLYHFARLIYGNQVAKSRSWLWSDAKPMSYYEQEAKKVEKNSLAVQFCDQYKAKLGGFDNTNMSMLTQGIHSKLSQNLPYEGFREHVHEFYVALDSFNKLAKNNDACDAIKKKRQIVESRFDGYVTNKDSYNNYHTWRIGQKVADTDIYSFKAFYNAHEELARTAKNLTDFWVSDQTEKLGEIPVTIESKVHIENQKRALQEKHTDMFQALQRYGVNQQILQRVGFKEKNNLIEADDNIKDPSTSFALELYTKLDGRKQ